MSRVGTSGVRVGASDEVVAADTEEFDSFGAELMARAIDEAITARAIARIAVSGGSTPGGAYRKLAAMDLPWSSTEWFWVDERAVPPDHERSNHRAGASDLQLSRGAIGPGRVHRMEADDPNLVAAAARYERLLRQSFGVASAVAFDLVLLGIGDDGHTASLFPGTGSIAIDDRLVLAVPARPEHGTEARLTLTLPVLLEARHTVFLARGANKRLLVQAARVDGDASELPARALCRAKGRVVWVLDRAAAGE